MTKKRGKYKSRKNKFKLSHYLTNHKVCSLYVLLNPTQMKLREKKIYQYLNSYIEQKRLLSESQIKEALVKDQLINISGNQFLLNCWQENTESGKVVCVELSRKKIFFLSEVYSLGVIFINGKGRKLEQEELWNMGY